MLLADRLITMDTIKSLVVNSGVLALIYWNTRNILRQPYLYDLAL